MQIKIASRHIGKGWPVFIIAEAGVNHNGDLELAKRLVDVAVDAGVDAVKFQTFKSEGVVTKTVGMAKYQEENLGVSASQLEMIKKFELDYESFRILKRYCDERGIMFLSAPQSFDAIDFLEELVPAYKFGSGDLTNIPALQHAANKKKPLILGTGMATMAEVREALRAIKSMGNDQIVALHCTTNYPCPLDEVNLRAMVAMRKALGCLVGYSDHTLSRAVSLAAVAMGACVIEKHFTVDKSLPGPDHKASLDPDELKDIVKAIRALERVLGSSEKRPTASEKEIMGIVRKSVVASQDIPEGATMTRDMLEIKRPEGGIKPKFITDINGKKARISLKKDDLITWKALDNGE